jgi:hypothetical protein
MQVASGSVITDADGTRQATLLFPQGTTATMRTEIPAGVRGYGTTDSPAQPAIHRPRGDRQFVAWD